MVDAITSVDQVVISQLNFTNVVLEEDGTIISFNNIKTIQASGIYLNNLRANDLNDKETTLIKINTLDLNSTFDSSYSGIVYDNSSIYVFQFGSFINSPPSTKTIKLENSIFRNSQDLPEKALVTTNQISTNYDVEGHISNITFTNISFTSSGYLILFNQQLTTNMTLTNSVFENIENGYILITTPSTGDTTKFTRVNIDNITVDSVKETTHAFISLTEQGKTTVTNSNFTNVYSFFDGSVLSGGSSLTETVMED